MADLDDPPAFWASIARTFRDDAAAVFDPFNEPRVPLSGIGWGNTLSSWLTYRPNDALWQLVAGLHVDDFSGCATPSCQSQEVAPLGRCVPVVTTASASVAAVTRSSTGSWAGQTPITCHTLAGPGTRTTAPGSAP